MLASGAAPVFSWAPGGLGCPAAACHPDKGPPMPLTVAIQMDPIERINIDADSTFALALEAQARGHALWHYLPQDLTLLAPARSSRARGRSRCARERGDHFTPGRRGGARSRRRSTWC